MIHIDSIESYRRWPIRPIDRAHVEALLQYKRNTEQDLFAPIKVWRDEDGLIYVLDGLHRLLAYLQEEEATLIPVLLIEASPEEALLLASSAASRPVKSSNGFERQDLAWMLVRSGYTYTAKEISQASGVSVRQVKYMRARAREFKSAEINPTGQWWRDRSDDVSEDCSNGGFSTMSKTETARAVKVGIKNLKAFIQEQGKENPAFKNDEGLARLFIGSLGEDRVKRIFSSYFGRDYDPLNLTPLPRVRDDESHIPCNKLDFE